MPNVSSLLTGTLVLLALSQPVAAGVNGRIADALAEPARSAADRERDAREKPQQVLALAGFERGMTVADVFGGGGYYSEILAGVVGKRGKVLLLNNAPYERFVQRAFETRLADGRLPNVEYRLISNDDLGLEPASLDGALINLSLHDLYYADPEHGWSAINDRVFLGQLVAALKPGAHLLVVDHSAKDGAGIEAAKTLHRIEEKFVIQELRRYGLEWTAAIPVLRNPADDRSLSAFDPAIRGRTDRFVHLYRKQGD